MNDKKWTTPEGIKEFKVLMEGQRVSWVRKSPEESPQMTRYLTIYPQTLTPSQQARMDLIEQELLSMAYSAEEETRTTTVVKGKRLGDSP